MQNAKTDNIKKLKNNLLFYKQYIINYSINGLFYAFV